MLTLQEFTLELRKNQVLRNDARQKIELEMDKLSGEQANYLRGMEQRIRQFEAANKVMEGQSKVHSTVQEAERLSAEISQLKRTERYLETAVAIETIRYGMNVINL
jgi:predicted  nucleic acid-binding Zn-ribbon protein